MINLVEEFGSLPTEIYVAVGIYATSNGGLLNSALQLPGSTNSDGNIDGVEYMLVQLITSQAGDFDEDGDVDGADFLKWQRGESPLPLSASDLADWQANYGTVAPLAASSAGVPEPATCVGLLLGMMAALLRRTDPARCTFR